MVKWHSNHRAFSLVEMLVVIGIIALLIGILLPALSSVQNRTKKTQELHHLRQIGIGWNMYGSFNNEAALPGYLEPEVQQRWRMRYEFPPTVELENQDLAIPEEVAAPWTWRLIEYMDYDFDTFWGYRYEPDRRLDTLVAQAEAVALEPAFAYNAFYVGGWWRIWPTDTGRPQVRFANAQGIAEDGTVGATPAGSIVIRSVSTVRRPGELILFCSATRFDQPMVYPSVTNDIEGSHLVTAPTTAEEPQWGAPQPPTGSGSDAIQAAETQYDLSPHTIATFASPAYAPIGRYNRLVPVLRADGSTDTNTPRALMDQRLWIDAATYRDFTHTEGN